MLTLFLARVVKLVNTHDSKSCAYRLESSSLSSGTNDQLAVKLFFDLLIITFLTATFIPAVILFYSRQRRPQSWEARHKNFSLFLSSLFFLGATTVLYGSFIEPHLLLSRKESLDLPGIDQPIKIAFVADFQVGPYRRADYVQQVVDKIQKFQPDFVLLGGDQVDNGGSEENEAALLYPFADLAEKIPVLAVHGNHEYGIGGGESIWDSRQRLPDISQETKSDLEKFGIRYLVNETITLTINNQKLYLYGADEYWTGQIDYESVENRIDHPVIALIHNPSFILTPFPNNFSLILSGHTHGGQIRLPFIGPIGRVQDPLPTQYYKGWSKLNNTKLFVTSGVGETGVRARLFNPPEIIFLTLY